MAGPRILALVLAGGAGTRLYPLTASRSKPSVPFGGRYYVVDFVLSNLINSHIYSIYLLVQYKSQSLIEHLRKAWVLSPVVTGHFVTVVPPQMGEGSEWFQGTADAVYQNLNLVRGHHPDVVAVFGADHVYRMDVRQMVRFHLERAADVTVAAIPVPLAQAGDLGVIGTDGEGRIHAFQEKPERPQSMPDHPECALASMGNYLFSTRVLMEALADAHRLGERDFGRHVLPRLLASYRLYAYDFASNQIPGIKPYEEAGYWRDVGTLTAYWEAHRDLLGLRPRFDLFNPQWPIRSSNYDGPTAKVIRGHVENSFLGAGTLVNCRHLRNSVVRREVVLEEGVEVDECLIMDYVVVGRGSRLRRVIVDRNNVLPAGTRIGFDPAQDRQHYQVDASGIVVVPAGGRELDLVY